MQNYTQLSVSSGLPVVLNLRRALFKLGSSLRIQSIEMSVAEKPGWSANIYPVSRTFLNSKVHLHHIIPGSYPRNKEHLR